MQIFLFLLQFSLPVLVVANGGQAPMHADPEEQVSFHADDTSPSALPTTAISPMPAALSELPDATHQHHLDADADADPFDDDLELGEEDLEEGDFDDFDDLEDLEEELEEEEENTIVITSAAPLAQVLTLLVRPIAASGSTTRDMRTVTASSTVGRMEGAEATSMAIRGGGWREDAAATATTTMEEYLDEAEQTAEPEL
ncbi:uncharacterized protein L3040_003820 [Drepanopeziza brunnea f. sp. 'multigermtubi']|uniref:Uncharacterized protein n=1 Tax=Marssonina brunnea f. sp. multigermtubi (strain MB_m1) TaxID=1072389 RepID=K1X2G6_MARBU|nr:uncharacterized protein MBM_06744 [Drepanopeziza brunnea f. sp. 'multigermtubi' MB_m1]EKD14983.1 hypothetical protein MBM_06744 [Drepanopeziza brunnea f. sp. 'multigermtubi' MB_m1]KAJ5046581.1 hypothetical protein L3040_003820 [Drepanopeziza brunnea f. sp. 'multigermtubi']